MPYLRAGQPTPIRGVTATSAPAAVQEQDENIADREQPQSGFMSAFANKFRQVVPQSARDVAGKTVQTALSGERALNVLLPGDPGTDLLNQVRRIPKVGNLTADVLDTVASPLTLATLGFGPALSAAVKAGRITGAAALGAKVLSPAVSGNLAQRAAAEVGMAAGSAAAAEGARALGADDTVAGAAGLVGGVLGARKVGGMRRAGIPTLEPSLVDDLAAFKAKGGTDPLGKLSIGLTHATRYRGREAKRLGDVVLPDEAKLTAQDFGQLHVRVTSHPSFTETERKSAATALNELLTGKLPRPYEGKLLEQALGPEFGHALGKAHTNGMSGMDHFLDALSVPRAVMTSFDLSHPFRQGAVMVGRKEFWGSWQPMVKSLFSEKYARATSDALLEDPTIRDGMERGLAILDWGAGKNINARTEGFMSDFAEKFIPGVKQSERAYVAFGNKLRGDVYRNTVNKWKAAKAQYTESDLDSLATALNTLTGRGKLDANTLTQVMNATMFAPGYFMSRVDLMSGRAYMSASPLVRKEIARDMVSFFGSAGAALGLLKASGEFMDYPVSVELDPRSTNFGKAQIGSTRLDPWAGFQPIARYLSQLAAGQSKGANGEINELNRGAVLGNFARSKLAPVPAFLVDALRGEDFIGRDVDVSTGQGIGQAAAERLVPLLAQDLFEAYQAEGLRGALLTTPAVFGVGSQTYDSVATIREAGAKEMFGKPWKGLNGEEQSAVEGAYSERLAAVSDVSEGSISKFIQDEQMSLQAFEQDALAGRQAGLVSKADFTKGLNDRLAERRHRIDAVLDREGKSDPKTKDLLDSYYALREQATGPAGVVDYELLEGMQDEFVAGLNATDRLIIEKRRSTLQHVPGLQWWLDGKKKIADSGYWQAQARAVDETKGLIDQLAPGIETYNQLMTASRDPNLTPRDKARIEAVVKRVNKLVKADRERMRIKDPELDAALVEVYGLKPKHRTK